MMERAAAKISGEGRVTNPSTDGLEAQIDSLSTATEVLAFVRAATAHVMDLETRVEAYEVRIHALEELATTNTAALAEAHKAMAKMALCLASLLDLHGIATQATVYAGTYALSGDTKLDTLRHFICELAVAEESCNGIILNPVDAQKIDLIKTEEGGTNKGAYVCRDPLGGTLRVPTYWSMPVVATNSMPQGKCLAGDFSKAVIYDRMNATVDISEQHSDYFVKNKIAIRCEERLLLAVLRPSAFRYGSI